MQQAAIAARSPLPHPVMDYPSLPPPGLPPPGLPPSRVSCGLKPQDENSSTQGTNMTSVTLSTERGSYQPDEQARTGRGEGGYSHSDFIQELPRLAELDPNFVFSEIEVYGFLEHTKCSSDQATGSNFESTYEARSHDKENLIRSLKKEGDAFSLSLLSSSESQLDQDLDYAATSCFDDSQEESGGENVNQDEAIDSDDEYSYDPTALNMQVEQEDDESPLSIDHFSAKKGANTAFVVVNNNDSSPIDNGLAPPSLDESTRTQSKMYDEESSSVTMRWMRWFQGINCNWQKQNVSEVPPQVRALLTAQRVWGTESLLSMRNATSFTAQRRAESDSSVRSVLSVSQDLALLSLPPSDELFLPSIKHRPRQVSLGDPIWCAPPKSPALQSQSPNGTVTASMSSPQHTMKDLPLPWPVSWRTVDTFVEECFNLNIHELFEAVIRFLVHAMAQEKVASLRLKKLREQGKQKLVEETSRKSSFFALFITSPQLNHLASMPTPPRKLLAKWEVLIWELARCAQGCASKLVHSAQKRQQKEQSPSHAGDDPIDGVCVLARWLLVLSLAIQFWSEIEEKLSSKLSDLMTNSSSEQMKLFLESGIVHVSAVHHNHNAESFFSTLKVDATSFGEQSMGNTNDLTHLPLQMATASTSPSLFDTLASSWHRTSRSPRLTVSGILFASLAATYHIVSELIAEQSSSGSEDSTSASSGDDQKPSQEQILDAYPCLSYDEFQACKQQGGSSLDDDLSSIGTPRLLVQWVVDAGANYFRQKLLEHSTESLKDASTHQKVCQGTTIRDLLSDIVMSIPSCSPMGRVRLWRPGQMVNNGERKSSPKPLEILESLEVDLTVFAASVIDLGDLPLETKSSESDNDSDACSDDVTLKRSLTEMTDIELEQEGYCTPKPRLKRIQQSEVTPNSSIGHLSDSKHQTPQSVEFASPQDNMTDSLTSSLRGEAELTPALLSVATAVLYGGNRNGSNVTSCSPNQQTIPSVMLPETASRATLSETQLAPPASTSPGLSTRSPLLGNLKVKLDLEPTGPEPLRLGSDDDVVEIVAGASTVPVSRAATSITQSVSAPSLLSQSPGQLKCVLTSSGSIVRPILKKFTSTSSSSNLFSGSGSGGLRKRKAKSRGITWAENSSLEKVRYFASSDAAAKANTFAGPPATPPPPDYSGILIEHIGLLSEEDHLSLIQQDSNAPSRSGGLAAAIRNRAAQNATHGKPFTSEGGHSPSVSTENEPESPNLASKIGLISELTRRQNDILRALSNETPGLTSVTDYLKYITSNSNVTASTLATVTWIHPIKVSAKPNRRESLTTPETEKQIFREKGIPPTIAGRSDLKPTVFEGQSFDNFLNGLSSLSNQRDRDLLLEEEFFDFDSMTSESQTQSETLDKRESVMKYLSQLDSDVPTFSFEYDDAASDENRQDMSSLTQSLEDSDLGKSEHSSEPKGSHGVSELHTKEESQIEYSAALKKPTKRSFLDYARARSNNQTGEYVSISLTQTSQFVSQPNQANQTNHNSSLPTATDVNGHMPSYDISQNRAQTMVNQEPNHYSVFQQHQYAPLTHPASSSYQETTTSILNHVSNDMYQNQMLPSSAPSVGIILSGQPNVNAGVVEQSYGGPMHQVQYQHPKQQSYDPAFNHYSYQHSQPNAQSYQQAYQHTYQSHYQQAPQHSQRQGEYQHVTQHQPFQQHQYQQPLQQTHQHQQPPYHQPQHHQGFQPPQENNGSVHNQHHYYQ